MFTHTLVHTFLDEEGEDNIDILPFTNKADAVATMEMCVQEWNKRYKKHPGRQMVRPLEQPEDRPYYDNSKWESYTVHKLEEGIWI